MLHFVYAVFREQCFHAILVNYLNLTILTSLAVSSAFRCEKCDLHCWGHWYR